MTKDREGTPVENARNDILMLCGASDDLMEQMRLRIGLLIAAAEARGMEKAATIERVGMTRITGLSQLKLSLMQNDSNRVILEKMLANARAEGIEWMKESLRKTGTFDPEILFEDGWHSGYRIPACSLSPKEKP